VGELLAKELQQRGGERLEILVGERAHARLEDNWGVTPKDLRVSRHIGAQLTKHEPGLVLLHLNRREMQGDTVLELGLWLDGESERISSLAGAGGDPTPGLLSSMMPLLSDVLPQGPVGDALDRPQRDVTTLIEAEEWTQAVAALAEREELGVREHYYRVLAYVRLGNRDAAIDSLNEMQTAHGQHFLVVAADELIPPARAVDEGADIDDIDAFSGSKLIDEPEAATEAAGATEE